MKKKRYGDLEDMGILFAPAVIVRKILSGKFEVPNIINVVNNPVRQEIIRYCHPKERSISDIMRHLKLSYNPTYKHVAKLKEFELVTTRKAIIEKLAAVVLVRTIDTRSVKPMSKKQIIKFMKERDTTS